MIRIAFRMSCAIIINNRRRLCKTNKKYNIFNILWITYDTAITTTQCSAQQLLCNYHKKRLRYKIKYLSWCLICLNHYCTANNILGELSSHVIAQMTTSNTLVYVASSHELDVICIESLESLGQCAPYSSIAEGDYVFCESIKWARFANKPIVVDWVGWDLAVLNIPPLHISTTTFVWWFVLHCSTPHCILDT